MSTGRVALALAGGGPLGAIHEIGALCALEEAVHGLDFTRLDHYVGVSAGAFIAAAMANGWQPRQLSDAFIQNSGTGDIFDPAWLTIPAYGEFTRRLARLPLLTVQALWRALWQGKPLPQVLEGFAPALPTGLFSNAEVHRRLQQIFSRPGRTNDFRKLHGRLSLVATMLDTGEAVSFGRPGWDHVPISRAVQASCALPGLFPPVEIDGHMFVDGALKKTVHASVVLEEKVDLLLCVNPLVPFRMQGIADAGLPKVLSQTFRTMIHSRLELGMKQYARTHPHTDIVLLEPDGADPELYEANTFSYGQRRHYAEHAYQHTRAWLLAQAPRLAPLFERHGMHLRLNVLRDPDRQLVPPGPHHRLGATVTRLETVLDDLDAALAAH